MRWPWVFTDVDGVFRLIVYPGPGVLAARANERIYIRGAGLEAINARRPDWLSHTRPGLRPLAQYHAFQWIEPAPDAFSVTQDLVVEPGRHLPVRRGL